MLTFLKNNRTDPLKKKGAVKRNDPFATTINCPSRYRESRSISLVQLRLLQGSQKEKVAHRATFSFCLRYGDEKIGASCKQPARFRSVGATCPRAQRGWVQNPCAPAKKIPRTCSEDIFLPFHFSLFTLHFSLPTRNFFKVIDKSE